MLKGAVRVALLAVLSVYLTACKSTAPLEEPITIVAFSPEELGSPAFEVREIKDMACVCNYVELVCEPIEEGEQARDVDREQGDSGPE